MKIVQLITRMDTIGGAQIHVRDLCMRLKKTGHSVYIVTGGMETVFEELGTNGINIIYCNALTRNLNAVADVKACLAIRRIIKKIQPDFIATHSSKAGIIGRVAGWSLRIPTIFTAHGWSFTEGVEGKKKRMYLAIEKLIGHITDGVITVSEYDKRLALQHKILPQEKLITIHNGVHETDHPGEEYYSSDSLNMIMVARFAPPKKQLDLLRALTKLQQFEWEMLFAGDGQSLQEAQQFVENEGLSERVRFLGNQNDITTVLQRSDLFILLSDWEGLPLSILEAMQCGLPIIASDVGGINEAVRQSVNGYVIPKNDEDELLNKLILLLNSPSLRLTMGKQSRLLYNMHFTFEQMYEKTYAYYEKIIEMKSAN